MSEQSTEAHEVERPPVSYCCRLCHVTVDDVVSNRVVVSPQGMAHFGDYGYTDCGRDATRDGWWWPL